MIILAKRADGSQVEFLLYENIQFSHVRRIEIGHRMEFFPECWFVLIRKEL